MPSKPKDKGAEELRFIPDKEDPTLATYKGPDGTKSLGYAKHPPKPGLPTDADDAGRGGQDIEGGIVNKPR